MRASAAREAERDSACADATQARRAAEADAGRAQRQHKADRALLECAHTPLFGQCKKSCKERVMMHGRRWKCGWVWKAGARLLREL